jgi:hypothetical protein
MASVQCFQTLALKPEAALQDGVSAIALNHATATGLYLPVITTVLFGDLDSGIGRGRSSRCL